MKKIFSIIIVCALCISASAQSTTTSSQQFLKRYSALVERINEKYAQDKDSVNTWKSDRSVLRQMYKERFRYTFTDEELEEYIKINTLCKTKMSKLQISNISDQVDSIGNNLGKSVKRIGKKFNGFLKGMKSASDENRKNN